VNVLYSSERAGVTAGVSAALRILLVDDHALVRIGLGSVIADEPGMEVCGEATTGARAIELYRSLRPGLVLMDLRLPDLSGAEATEAIRREFPDAKLLVVSSFAPDEEVYAAIAAGAQGYVLKTIETEQLVAAIRTVASGLRHIPPEIAARLAARIPRSDLTDRERDVLRLLVRGRRNREIAEQLTIAEGTVKTHVANILLKLGATDRTEAATVAIERGIITLG
jgi:DNA-binding NarL/FixJ family response regulator